MARRSPLNAVHLMVTSQLTGNLQVLAMASPAQVYSTVPRGAVFPYAKLNMTIANGSPRVGGQHDVMASIQVDIFDDNPDRQRVILLSDVAMQLLCDRDLSLPDTDGFRFIDQKLEIERLQEEANDEGNRIWHQILIVMFHCNQITI